jgi:hypothetical protein
LRYNDIAKIKKQTYERVENSVACAILGVSKTTLQNYRDQGCPHEKEGSKNFYNIPEVIKWLVDIRTKKTKLRAQKNVNQKIQQNQQKIENDDHRYNKAWIKEQLLNIAESDDGIARIQALKETKNMLDSEPPKIDEDIRIKLVPIRMIGKRDFVADDDKAVDL